jgi:hypothetical protein
MDINYYMRTGLFIFPCPSKAEIMYKYKVNGTYYVASRPEF